MGQIAVQAARACRYTNAGTVEFLLDDEKNFYFLEMNTRIQVEHPVTEMVTGIDLLKLQIQVAQGEPIPENISPTLRGAAIECRIYAEDPYNNFLPSPGKVHFLSLPQGPGIRNDCGVYKGYRIPMEYDPMIAKLVVWGENREAAIQRMTQALAEYRVLGIKTNISYLDKIITHPQFGSGNYNTQFLNTYWQDLQEARREGEDTTALIAAGILRYLQRPDQGDSRADAGTGPTAWKLSGRIYKNGSIF
jgi:acetyl-CoA carboxylase biotin carboxylase subunit